MATLTPVRKKRIKFYPRALVVYQVTKCDTNDTIECPDFDPNETLETAVLVNTDTGVEITTTIVNNVVTVGGSVDDVRCYLVAVGLTAP